MNVNLILRRVRKTSGYVAAAFLGGILASSADVADKVLNVTDRLEWTKSEEVRLAENTARSQFSDSLIRSSWRRLFLADLYARRVLDASQSEPVGMPLITEITDAWHQHVAAMTDWNSDLMINIVGIEHYYDAQKSAVFEDAIQDRFISLDLALRDLRLSSFVQKSLSGSGEISKEDRADAERLADSIFFHTDVDRQALYFFVRCFSKNVKGVGNCNQMDNFIKAAEEVSKAKIP